MGRLKWLSAIINLTAHLMCCNARHVLMVVILLTSLPAKYTVKMIIKLNELYAKFTIRIYSR